MRQSFFKDNQLKTLTNDFLDQAILKRKNKIKSCFKNKKDYGTLTFEMTVLRSGSNRIRLIDSDLKERGAIQCIFFLLEKIKFLVLKD